MASDLIRPSVFVGSSQEGIEFARAVRGLLTEDADISLWNEGFFSLGKTFIESLTTAVSQFDFAVIILTPDDLVKSRSTEFFFGPRDNLLFELGLFMGQLGRDRTFILHELNVNLKVPTDLSGVKTAQYRRPHGQMSYQAAVGAACDSIRDVIRSLGRRATATAEGELRNTSGREIQARIYQNVGDIDFLRDIRAVITQTSSLTLIGLGLNILESADIRDLIVERARAGVLNATICFGNPWSPAVRSRLAEEERSDIPPVVAANGIINRVAALLTQTVGVGRIAVKLFSNYPTMAILKFDDKYVYYPMGYRRLGNQCPAIWVHAPSIFSTFLDETIATYLEDAVDAAEILRVRYSPERSREFVDPKKVCAIAVYIIPSYTSPFYIAGSELLGYDVLRGRVLDAEQVSDSELQFFRRFAGSARNYGFHLTVADLMYLPTAQLSTLISELREIASSVRPFALGRFRLREDVVSRGSLVLSCADDSGELERLHAEVAVRIRQIGLGTNFTLDPPPELGLDSMSSRDRTMIRTYQSPYVFRAFEPHFTLAAPGREIDAADRARLRSIIQNRFSTYLNESRSQTIHVDRLWVLTRAVDQELWDTAMHKVKFGLA